MFIFIEDIKKMKGFINKEIDFSKTLGFKVVGFFPYHTKAIKNSVKVSRNIFHELERILAKSGIYDNKYVIVCEDTVNFGTEDFAINFKDYWAAIGKLEDIVDY